MRLTRPRPLPSGVLFRQWRITSQRGRDGPTADKGGGQLGRRQGQRDGGGTGMHNYDYRQRHSSTAQHSSAQHRTAPPAASVCLSGARRRTDSAAPEERWRRSRALSARESAGELDPCPRPKAQDYRTFGSRLPSGQRRTSLGGPSFCLPLLDRVHVRAAPAPPTTWRSLDPAPSA